MKLSERQIIKTCKENKITVHYAIKKFKKEGTFAGKKRTRRPRIFSSREKRLMRGEVTRYTMTSVCVFSYQDVLG